MKLGKYKLLEIFMEFNKFDFDFLKEVTIEYDCLGTFEDLTFFTRDSFYEIEHVFDDVIFIRNSGEKGKHYFLMDDDGNIIYKGFAPRGVTFDDLLSGAYNSQDQLKEEESACEGCMCDTCNDKHFKCSNVCTECASLPFPCPIDKCEGYEKDDFA